MANEKLRGLIADVNPMEIAQHIEAGNLHVWCHAWRDAASSSLPSCDADEVVHGRCAWCNGDYHTKIMATAIRYHSNGNMDGYEMKVNYCPNCGAIMDGGNEDG